MLPIHDFVVSISDALDFLSTSDVLRMRGEGPVTDTASRSDLGWTSCIVVESKSSETMVGGRSREERPSNECSLFGILPLDIVLKRISQDCSRCKWEQRLFKKACFTSTGSGQVWSGNSEKTATHWSPAVSVEDDCNTGFLCILWDRH